MKKNVVGADLGFVQLKGVGKDWDCTCPSLSKRRSEVIMGDLNDSEGYLITTEHGGSWNVGSKGSFDFKSERLASESDLPKLLTVLGLYQEATGVSTIDLLVSGLPVEEYKREASKLAFAEKLKGDFNFGFNAVQRLVRVSDSLVLPQSAGAFFDFVLDDAGEERNTELASEDLLILDIGGMSTDGCIMEEGAFSQDSFTIWEGVHEVQKELRKLISHKFSYVPQPMEVDRILRTGLLKLGGKQAGVQDLVQKAIEVRLPTLQDELSLHVPDFRRFSAVILCGGGAHVYTNYITEFTGVQCLTMGNAELANANGYRKYGLLKLAEG